MKDLWTNGLDQYSWTLVIDAATKANKILNTGTGAENDKKAMNTVFRGFINVGSLNSPSHNVSQWSIIRSFCIGILYLPGNQSKIIYNKIYRIHDKNELLKIQVQLNIIWIVHF